MSTATKFINSENVYYNYQNGDDKNDNDIKTRYS
jgi:hypothetical protein